LTLSLKQSLTIKNLQADSAKVMAGILNMTDTLIPYSSRRYQPLQTLSRSYFFVGSSDLKLTEILFCSPRSKFYLL